MRIQLSDHFTYKKLFRFVLPSVVMMIFTSIYGVVDGLFVSNFAGKIPFASLNLIMPVPMLLGSLGFMIGSGGAAIVSKTLGEKKEKKANEYFSMLIISTIIGGVILAVLGFVLLPKVATLLGATEEMHPYCVLYGRITMLSLPFFMLQYCFQNFLVVAEKPKMGLAVTIAAGCTNMVLDFLLVGVLRLGVGGAAAATACSELVGGLIPLIYFIRKNDSLLRFCRAKIEFPILGRACFNGASELMTNVSMALVNMLYNLQLMKFAGENGVAAYGTIMYVNFVFVAIFIGYSMGSSPIVGYNYGAQNHDELKNMFTKSLRVVITCGVIMFVAAMLLSNTLTQIFVGYDADLFTLTRHGFRLFAISYLILGFNIYGSGFFTALGNGLISAIISFARTLLFQIVFVLLLPVFLGTNGIWLAITGAESAALVVTIWFLVKQRRRYQYI